MNHLKILLLASLLVTIYGNRFTESVGAAIATIRNYFHIRRSFAVERKRSDLYQQRLNDIMQAYLKNKDQNYLDSKIPLGR